MATRKRVKPSTGGTPLTISGSLIDQKYRLEELLGEGAAGIVYRAVHVGLEKSFAIKLLKTSGPPAPAALELFRREAVALGRLRHPHIVEVTDCGIDEAEGSLPYIVTELLEGRPLSDVCRDRGPLTLAQALPFLEQIAAAIDAAHEAGVLHRDLKPGNVFVCSESPESPSVKVLDFGLAELLAEKEILQTSRASDIYSFGVLAYEILGGRPPLRGTLEPPLPVPPKVRRALLSTLQSDPSLRPSTAGEIAHQLVLETVSAEQLCHNMSVGIPRPRLGTNTLTYHGPSGDCPESLHTALTGFERQYSRQHFLYPRDFAEHSRLRHQLVGNDSGIRDAIRRRLRNLKPRIKSLLSDLGLKKTGADLAGGTAFLTYFVSESRSFLLVQWHPGSGLFLYRLAIGREELARKVEAFRNIWIQSSVDHSAFNESGRHLYDVLVRPAKRVLDTADRWIILPEPPLQSLPFETLFSGTQYLADSKPIYFAFSTEERRYLRERYDADRRAGWADRKAKQEAFQIDSLSYSVPLTGIRNPQPRSRRSPTTLQKHTSLPHIKTKRLVSGKYQLQRFLGEGAIGVVYRAVHVGLEKAFAIKLLKTSEAPSPAALERFRREALALGRLRHPHIVEVTDSGIDDGYPYIVTELLEGRPLSDICREQGPLPLSQAFSLLRQIAAAIDAAHDVGIIHRDLKPGNVFVCEDRRAPHVKVLDFGLAGLLVGPDRANSGRFQGEEVSSPAVTTTGSLLGTPMYVAPEVIRVGQASRSSDIYSFGVLAYEILGGQPPFRGTLKDVLMCHLEADPPPLPLPPELWRPLSETLQKQPSLRPGTAGEVVLRLQEGVLEAQKASRRPALPVPHNPRRVRAEVFRELHPVIREALQDLRAPEPRCAGLASLFLGLKEARAHLAPGTALLTYYVGESQSFLFVIEEEQIPGIGFFRYPLAIGRAELSREVEAFRKVWRQRGTDFSALKECGRHLYDLLVRPADPVLGKADRWLISPDESLHSLPFATLFSGTQYLAASKAIYVTNDSFTPVKTQHLKAHFLRARAASRRELRGSPGGAVRPSD